mmetsp:Transcript_32432/g.28718  ORF Transcript_32432/g.28718 Transcript_32432/m.28718 type:complete len:170 (-) Transcript_32432:39-548(-)
MEYYTQSHLPKDTNLKSGFFPRILNISALAVQAYIAYIFFHFAGIIDTAFIVAYASTMGWSITYHLLPFLTHNIVFRFLHRVFSYVIYFLTMMTAFLYLNTEHDWSPTVYLAFLIYFLLPASFIAFSLNWLMKADRASKKTTVRETLYDPGMMYVQQQKVQASQLYSMI